MLGLGLKINNRQNVVSGYSAQYQAVIDYAVTNGYTLPSEAVQIADDAMVTALVDAGIWSQIDIFYMFATDGNANFAYINMVSPGTFNCINGASAPTISSSGLQFTSGSSTFVNTKYNPRIHGTNKNVNSTSLVVGIGSNTSGIVNYLGAFSGAERLEAQLVLANCRGYIDRNGATANITGTGHLQWYRTNSSTVHTRRNLDTVVTDGAYPANALEPNAELILGAVMQNTTPALFCTANMRFFLLGSGNIFSDRNLLVNTIETRLDAISAGML